MAKYKVGDILLQTRKDDSFYVEDYPHIICILQVSIERYIYSYLTYREEHITKNEYQKRTAVLEKNFSLCSSLAKILYTNSCTVTNP